MALINIDEAAVKAVDEAALKLAPLLRLLPTEFVEALDGLEFEFTHTMKITKKPQSKGDVNAAPAPVQHE